MMLKITSSGTWWVSSKTDPRWDASGTADSVGGLVMPREARTHIDKVAAKLGPPPDDLEYGYMKD